MTDSLEFGPFRLDLTVGLLMYGEAPVELGRRGVSLLHVLLLRAGQPISKEELIRSAWPGMVVEDSNLTVQVAALRKALAAGGGAQWIETLPRRGYRYVGPTATSGATISDRAMEASPQLALPSKPSIAVLPFGGPGSHDEQDHLAQGMVDEITSGLARIKWLFVIARGSTDKYRALLTDLKRVGRELGVRYVLHGTVRSAAARVRVSCQLAESSTGAQVWGHRYDRKREDVFALQDDVALAVVAAIEPTLRRAEAERVRRKRPESLDAYELVLRSQKDVFSGMPEPSSRALALLDRALALEPEYALAHAYAAMCHHNRYLRAGLMEAERAASVHHAREAIANGQDDALALTLAAFSLGMDAHDRAAAFAAFEAALRVSPSSALTYILGSVILAWGGEAKRAIDWAKKGLRLSPFDPWAFAAHHSIMLGAFKLGRIEEAASAAYRAVQSNPAHSISYMLLAAALMKRGRASDARSAAAMVLKLQPGFSYRAQFSGVNCDPALAETLGAVLRAAGLPE